MEECSNPAITSRNDRFDWRDVLESLSHLSSGRTLVEAITSLPEPEPNEVHHQHSEIQTGMRFSETFSSRFSPSEFALMDHALRFRWTRRQTNQFIDMIQSGMFNQEEISKDLQKRFDSEMAKMGGLYEV